MSELVGRVVSAIFNAEEGWDDGLAAINEVLSAMRKPGEEIKEALRMHSLDLHSPEEIMQAVCDAFAREHGLADG